MITDTKIKTEITKKIQISAHERTINQYEWKFVCAKCNKATSRLSYAFFCPKYCVSCAQKKGR